MKQLASKLKRYLHIYRHILIITFKYMLEYRLNFLVRSLHSIFYVGMLLVITLVIYQQTTTLGGWAKNEALLLFSLVHVTYGVQSFLFMRGMEEFMRLRVKSGDYDLDLVKPVHHQFMALFRKPWVDSFVFSCLMVAMFVRQALILQTQISWLSLGMFVLNYLMCLGIWYLVLSSYATISFYITDAQQVMYFIEKASDFAQYPLSIFPQGVQRVLFSVLPLAFVSYIPSSILLNKAQPKLWLITVGMLIISYLINQLTWKEGLKRYSSASS